MDKFGKFSSVNWVRAACEIGRRIGAENDRVAPATVLALVLEQPLLANRPALAALLKRVRADVRRTDWVGQTAVDRLELPCRDTSREQASKMLLRLAEHVDATFPLTELNSPPDEKAGVEAGEGRQAGWRRRPLGD